MALVSILIPVYNTARYLGATIQSVLNQTFADFELIVVDDCSTDNSLAIARQLAAHDPRIKIFQNQKNLGMMANWNRGLAECKSKYFVKLDADDRWHPNMVETCVRILEADETVGLVFTRYALMDEHDTVLNAGEQPLPGYARNQAFSGIDLVKRGTLTMLNDDVLKQGIGLIRRKVFDELGSFTLHDAGDTEMWFRIGAHYKFYGVDQTYYYYRVWPDNFTRTQVLKLDKKEANLFSVRQLIINYYHQVKLISDKEHTTFSKDNTFEHNKYTAYKFRREKKYAQFFKIVLANLISKPGATLSFYISRLKDRTRQ